MKENQGHFKQKSEPTIIGDKNKDEPDVSELLNNYIANRAGGDDESGEEREEDNQEGMGNINLEENFAEADSGDEEEKDFAGEEEKKN